MSGKKYDPKKIEKKWQKFWEKNKTFEVAEDKTKQKFYSLVEFPYPSGEGLHVGHPRPFTAMDVVSRKKRMEGYNVLFPIGFDAFGLPTENYAIKTGKAPAEVTKKNIANFTRQLKMLGYSFDWSRQVNTSDPRYYKWTQWLFLQFFKHGLAYKKNQPVNWCPKDKIGLANEEVVNGCCERCGAPVEKRNKEQWMLAITKYADKLLEGLKHVDYVERAKVQQENWIGRSEGAEIKFDVIDENDEVGQIDQAKRSAKRSDSSISSLAVFTTRPDTLFGATYMVVSPEHSMIHNSLFMIQNKDEIEKYVEQAKHKTDLERAELQKEKTGVELKGIKAVNPASGEEIPVWVADYVLANYGTGAIMAVPAYDERDLQFAEKYNLPIVNIELEPMEKMIAWLEEKGVGKKQVQYKLRDWVFSRQRYWGEPIPLVYCEHCGGWMPVSEKDLPLELPKVKKYQPTDTGESPLAAIEKWVKTKCPKCGGPARRETDTMPNWAGSSWYFLRYCDPRDDKEFASMEKLRYWMNGNSVIPNPTKSGEESLSTPTDRDPSSSRNVELARDDKAGGVDWYNGGMEHTVLHLLYSRFWNIFLHDIGLVPTSEPYKKRTSHGMILGPDGEKMSKSRGNVINPDEMVEKFGADALRTYIMFMGPFDQAVAWDTNGMVGVRRFLEKVWGLKKKLNDEVDKNDQARRLNKQSDKTITTLLHQTIKKVTEDIDAMRFNTAIAKMMELVNEMSKADELSAASYKLLLKILSPFAPHITEEIWSSLGNKTLLAFESWPQYDPELARESEITLAVQVNGKLRDTLVVPAEISEEEAKQKALASDKVQKWLEGKEPKKIIYVKNKLISIVI